MDAWWSTSVACYWFLAAHFLLMIIWYGFNISARWKLRAIPGPKPSFLIGNMLDRPIATFHENLVNWPRQYGKMMRFFLGKGSYVLCTDPTLIYQAAVKDFIIFHDRKQPMWSTICPEDEERAKWDILWSKGKFWSTIRAASDSLFHTKALVSYAEGMHEAIQKFIDDCIGHEGGFEVSRPLRQMSLQIIGSAAFGIDFCNSGKGSNKLVDMLIASMESPSVPPIIRFLAVAFPFTLPLINIFYRQCTNAKSYVTDYLHSNAYLVGASKALLRNCKMREQEISGVPMLPSELAQKEEKSICPGRKIQLAAQDEGFRDYIDTVPMPNSLFHKMIKTQFIEKNKGAESLTDIQIISQAIVFIIAGFDTSSTALSFALYELAKNQTFQAIIRREIQEFDTKGKPSLEQTDLADFPFTQACLLEALRLYPAINPAYVQQRVALQDTSLGSHYIPKGTTVIFNTLGLSVDSELFKNPQEFRPERFLKNEGSVTKIVQPPGFLSFGSGPHKFAIQECVFTLVAFHRKFLYTLDPLHHTDGEAMQLHPGIVFGPKKGVWLRLSDFNG